MKKKNKLKEYFKNKARIMEMSDINLSLKMGKSKAFISCIKNVTHLPSEKVLYEIAEFFGDNPYEVIFKAHRIPTDIFNMIIDSEDLQKFLIEEAELKKINKKDDE